MSQKIRLLELLREAALDDYDDAMCDRCLRTRRRSQLRKVKGEKVTVLLCRNGCNPELMRGRGAP